VCNLVSEQSDLICSNREVFDISAQVGVLSEESTCRDLLAQGIDLCLFPVC